LNFLALFLTAMNSPLFLFRLIEVLVSGFFNCVRFFTAPLRALSPLRRGSFRAGARFIEAGDHVSGLDLVQPHIMERLQVIIDDVV